MYIRNSIILECDKQAVSILKLDVIYDNSMGEGVGLRRDAFILLDGDHQLWRYVCLIRI